VDELGAVRREERVRHRVSHRRGLTVRSGRPTRILLMTQGEDRGRQRKRTPSLAPKPYVQFWPQRSDHVLRIPFSASRVTAFDGAGFPRKLVWWGGFPEKTRLVGKYHVKTRLVCHTKREKS
jgi:hypothetical protein